MSGVLSFVVKRTLAMVIVAWIIVTVVFFLARLSPYDPARLILQLHQTPHLVSLMRHRFGLDQPEWKQYVDYLGGLLHGNLGYSLERDSLGASVAGILQSGAPVTLRLGAYALVLALLVGLPIGLISALKQNSIVDHAGQSIMILLYVIPAFALVPLCQMIFGALLHWLPVSGWGDSGWYLGGWIPRGSASLKEMVLPVTIYAAGLAGFFAKSFRSFMLEVLRQDYIRTARAKGLKNRVIIYLHAAKNTLVPLASIVGPTVAYLILGAFIVEYLFSIPGIAFITVEAVTESNFPVIEATTLLLALVVVVVNMLTDIFYVIIDPRVRL